MTRVRVGNLLEGLNGKSKISAYPLEEEEESPTATDCTSLTLVDTVLSQPAPLSGENQDYGEEVRDCLKDDYSAAPPAQNEKLSTSVIADQKIELNRPSVELMTLYSVSGEALKADREGTFSATPAMPNFENSANQP